MIPVNGRRPCQPRHFPRLRGGNRHGSRLRIGVKSSRGDATRLVLYFDEAGRLFSLAQLWDAEDPLPSFLLRGNLKGL